MTQKNKVIVHLRNEQDRINGSGTFHGLNAFGIEYEVVMDTIKWANRSYPYLEVGGHNMCIKRIIRAKQEGRL